MNVVRHDFKRVHGHVPIIGDLVHQLLQPVFDTAGKDRATVFRTPDEVILKAKNCPGIPRISGFLGAHVVLYTRGTPNVKSKKKGRLPLSASADSPRRTIIMATSAAQDFNVSDVMFVSKMLDCNKMAQDMMTQFSSEGSNPWLQDFAAKMAAGRQVEMDAMRAWLKDRSSGDMPAMPMGM